MRQAPGRAYPRRPAPAHRKSPGESRAILFWEKGRPLTGRAHRVALAPIRGGVVVPVNVLFPFPVIGRVMAFGRPARRAAKLVFGEVELIGIELGVVLQDAPGQRVVFLAKPHEPAEAHDRISDLSGPLLDHHPLDRPDLVAVGTADRSSLDLIAGDQVMGLANVAALCRRLHHLAPSRLEIPRQRSGEKTGSGSLPLRSLAFSPCRRERGPWPSVALGTAATT